MKIIADLHIHSPYSRAVSKDMTLPNIDLWCRKKGIKIVGTGDFTHPLWFNSLKNTLEPAEPGFYKCKGKSSGTRFILTTEISSIYSHGGKVRRVHNLIFAPSFEVAEKINSSLEKKGAKLTKDGRPIVGLSSRDLLKIALAASEDCLFVPAHAWTPWFAVFGSESGYDSLQECFEEDAKYIFAIETGLSSDKEMNWRLSSLDKVALISNSDPHSLHRLGREANIFEMAESEFSYFEMIKIIRGRDNTKFLSTVEYFPEEGRYHYDGDREHGVVLAPSKSDKLNNRCPKCAKLLTIGVLSRVEKLADRPHGFVPPNAVPGKHLVPLEEIIADPLGVKSVMSRKVVKIYDSMVENYEGGELSLLLDADLSLIKSLSNDLIAEGVKRVRSGDLNISPGYDGVYGQVKIFSDEERREFSGNNTSQGSLF